MGSVRPRSGRLDCVPSVRLETTDREGLPARVPLSGGAGRGGSATGRTSTGPGKERALRPLPGFDALRELRRPSRNRIGGPRTRGPRRRPRLGLGSSCSNCAAAWQLPLDLPVSHRKITVVLDLPGTVEELRKGRSPSCAARSSARRRRASPSASAPTRWSRSSRSSPGTCGTWARRPSPSGSSVKLPRAFGEDAWFAGAWHQGRPVGSGAGFRWGDEFEMTWSSSLGSTRGSRPTCCSTGTSWSGP